MVAPPTLQRITVAEAIDAFLRTTRQKVVIGQFSERTCGIYTRDLADFAVLAGPSTVLDDVTGDDVDSIMSRYAMIPDRRRKVANTRARSGVRGGHALKSVSTQTLFHTTLTAFFRTAEKRGWVQSSPMLYTQLRPAKNHNLRVERRALTLDQAQALLEFGAGQPGPSTTALQRHSMVRDRCVFSLMVFLGPRVSEVTSANLSDFVPNTTGGAVWTVMGKGHKERALPLSSSLYGLVSQYQQLRRQLVADGALSAGGDDEAAFVSSRGNRINDQAVQRSLNAAVRRLQALPQGFNRGATPHALRHTAATLMLANGWDVKVVSGLLGHENIATTSRYLDELPGELERAIANHPLSDQLATEREAVNAA